MGPNLPAIIEPARKKPPTGLGITAQFLPLAIGAGAMVFRPGRFIAGQDFLGLAPVFPANLGKRFGLLAYGFYKVDIREHSQSYLPIRLIGHALVKLEFSR